MRSRWLVPLLTLVLSCTAFAEKAVVKVVGPNGKPIKGAQVLVSTSRGCPPPGTPTPKTDKYGKYKATFSGVAGVYVYATGYVPFAARVKKGENLVKLERAGSVKGTVVDKAGKPVAGTTVALWYARRPDGTSTSFS